MFTKLIQANAAQIPLRDESVHCAVGSPPYWNLRVYLGEPVAWPATRYRPMPGLDFLSVESWRGCLGQEATPEAYTAHIVSVFREVWRVLRDDGTAWLNIGDSYAGSGMGWSKNNAGYRKNWLESFGNKRPPGYISSPSRGLKPRDLVGVPWRIAFALQADGWYVRGNVIWVKGMSFCPAFSGSVTPESVKNRPTRSFENLLLLTKRPKGYFYNYIAAREPAVTEGGWPGIGPQHSAARGRGEGNKTMDTRPMRNLRSVWALPPSPYKGKHFAVFPPSLVKPCIEASTSTKGCCPHCGAPWQRTGVEDPAEDETHDTWTQLRFQPGALEPEPVEENPDELLASWRQGCGCELSPPVPAVVLDPFVGSGTTLLVAAGMGRAAIGLDLSHVYLHGLAQKRLGFFAA